MRQRDTALNRRAFLRTLGLGGAALLGACQSVPATQPVRGGAPAPAAPGSADAPPGGDWEARWNALVEAAKNEGELLLHGPPNSETRQKVPEAFTRRFGIPVHYNATRTSELAPRMITEKQAGLVSVDMLLTGLGTLADDLYPAGLIADLKPHLILPEVTDPAVWTDDVFLDPEQSKLLRLLNSATPVIAVNRDFVDPSSIQESRDLLKPEFKGKIAADDPAVRGSGGNMAAYLLLLLGEEYIAKLYGEQVVSTRDYRQWSDWLARGAHPVALGPNTPDVEVLIKDGFPITVIRSLKDVPGWTSGSFGIAGIVEGAPHPNAARLFANWIASREGLEVFSRSERLPGTRKDLNYAQWVAEFCIPVPGTPYLDTYNWDFKTKQQTAAMEKVREVVARR